MAYSIPKTWAYKETLASSDLNTYVRDNIINHEARLIAEHDASGAHTTDFSLLSTDGTFASNSDAVVPSEKAAKTYADTKVTLAAAQQDLALSSSHIQRQGIINGGMEISQELVTGTVALVNNTAKYACDLFSIKPSGTAVSAGTQAQIANSTIGTSGYALKLAGVTITGSGTIQQRYRMEAADAVKYKNKQASFGMLELQDTGGSLNYTIQINKATVADNFASVTQIAISGNLAVPSATGTLIKLENVSMGDCSNGIEICVTIPCGAITTKNFETTEWRMNVGAVVLPFVCGSRVEELAKILRYIFQITNVTEYEPVAVGVVSNTTMAYVSMMLPVEMRTVPTLSYSALADFRIYDGSISTTPTVIVVSPAGLRMVQLAITSSGMTAANVAIFSFVTNLGKFVKFDARFTA
jgi:hypothetical protein